MTITPLNWIQSWLLPPDPTQRSESLIVEAFFGGLPTKEKDRLELPDPLDDVLLRQLQRRLIEEGTHIVPTWDPASTTWTVDGWTNAAKTLVRLSQAIERRADAAWCHECGAVFMPAQKRPTMYCGDLCRARAQMRLHRAKRQAAQANP